MSHLPATTTPTALELCKPGLTEALAERWLLSLPSANTRAAYRRDLAAFASWCAEQGATPLEAGRYELDAYRDHLAQLGRKPATIARALSALSSFYEYALDAAPQLLSANPAARVKRPKVSAESSTLGLSKAEAEAFLAAARASSATDYALGCLLLLNGLRVSEALGLDVADYYPEGEHYVAEVLGKGGRVDKVALARRTLAALAAVTEDREAGPVFTDAAGERMNRHQATRVVRRLARAAGIAKPERISPHSCRHAFVTLSLQAGVPLHRVQYAARHANADTTLRYDRAASALEGAATYTLTEFLGA